MVFLDGTILKPCKRDFVMSFASEDLDKYERIKQLGALGFNVPLLMRIPCGTKFDKNLQNKLLKFASGRKLMTVRSYASSMEKLHGGAPFHPEIPVRSAIAKVRQLLPRYHVLFQEAIDVNQTRLVGRTLFDPAGRNSFEALRGRVRVRDLDNPPRGRRLLVGFYSTPGEVEDAEIGDVLARIHRLPVILREPNPIIVEWNLQEDSDLVGVRNEPFLLWEWRPGI